MTRQYFEEHVTYAVEVESDYGRIWRTFVGVRAMNKYLTQVECSEDMWISDVDLSCKQEDKEVRDFLNRVEYNLRHNPKCKGKSFNDILGAMLVA